MAGVRSVGKGLPDAAFEQGTILVEWTGPDVVPRHAIRGGSLLAVLDASGVKYVRETGRARYDNKSLEEIFIKITGVVD